jgi:hypothetical protein
MSLAVGPKKAVELQQYVLNQDYPLIEFGHTREAPPVGSLVRVTTNYATDKSTSYVVVQCLKPSVHGMCPIQHDLLRKTEIVGANVFRDFAGLRRADKGTVKNFYSDCTANMMYPNDPVTTVAVLAEDFFEYLKTARKPLEEQFPPAAGSFVISYASEGPFRQTHFETQTPHQLGLPYPLDEFARKITSLKKGALLKIEQTLKTGQETGQVSVKNIVFQNFKLSKDELSIGRVLGTWVYGLDIDVDRHAQELAICGKHFVGTLVTLSSNHRVLKSKPPLPCMITVVADDYFAFLREASSASVPKSTDVKKAEN